MVDSNYSRSYGYDEFGNLFVKGHTGINISGLTPYNDGATNPFNPATNHLITVEAAQGYEARGPVTKLGAVTMAYDAKSNMTNTVDTGTGQSITWTYDAEGQRTQKQIMGGATTVYVHDAFGKLAAEYNSAGVAPACKTCYLSYDALGNVRFVTNGTAVIIAHHDYLPFGEEVTGGAAGRTGGNFGVNTNVNQMLTGQERDGGTAMLDYFNARHYSAYAGGFMQPDPGNAGADFVRPQSWNAYAYVLGNPLGYTDPSGACPVVLGGVTQSRDPNGGITAIAEGLGAVDAYPYAGLGFGPSVLDVAAQGLAPTINTMVALEALRYAMSTNSGKIDIVAYSAVLGHSLQHTESCRVASSKESVTYSTFLPGANGSLVTNHTTSIVRGSGPVDVGAMIGTGYPRGTPVEQVACGHTDVACLSNASTAISAFNAMEANGPCTSQRTFSFSWLWKFSSGHGTATSTISDSGQPPGQGGGPPVVIIVEGGGPIGVLGGGGAPKPQPARPF